MSWRVFVGTLALGIFSRAATAHAINYYISPNGNDGNSGTSSALPWKTFSHAIPRLAPGDSLILKNGTYDASNSGYVNINCTAGAHNGTEAARIAVRAENERLAFLKGDESVNPFTIKACAYWDVVGLHIEHTDSGLPAAQGYPLYVQNSSQLRIRRNLVLKSNRCANAHGIGLHNSHNNLIEENEIYMTHRHHIFLYDSNFNTVRRNYGNRRVYPAVDSSVCGRAPSIAPGTEGISLYPAHSNLIENNIMETTRGNPIPGQGFVVNATRRSDDNRFFGNIALNSFNGIKVDARGNSQEQTPHNTLFVNQLVVGTQGSYGLLSLGASNTRCNNCTIVQSTAAGIRVNSCVRKADGTEICGAAPRSFFANNTITVGSSASGFSIAEVEDFGLDYVNVFNNAQNPTPSVDHPKVTNELLVDPNLGTCLAWVPAHSPMKGAGRGGADVGATILYEYQDGVLTNVPLWASSLDGGRFSGCGAVVEGVNDVNGQSCRDVHKRLNVNANGCAFPPGYGAPVSIPHAPASFVVN